MGMGGGKGRGGGDASGALDVRRPRCACAKKTLCRLAPWQSKALPFVERLRAGTSWSRDRVARPTMRYPRALTETAAVLGVAQ